MTSATAAVIARLAETWNRRDLPAFLACFDVSYESVQPLHPERSFRGQHHVGQRWAAQFAAAGEFRADLLAFAIDGEKAWTEWHWHGSRPDGSRRDERGVIVYTVRDERIVAGRLYIEPGPDDASHAPGPGS